MVEVNLIPHEPCPNYQYWKSYFAIDKPSAYQFIEAPLLDYLHNFLDKYFNATARNTFRRAIEKYEFHSLTWDTRNDYLQDIHEVNLSALQRQGKPMSKNYLEFPATTAEAFGHCRKHFSRFFAIMEKSSGKLVGYINGSYCGTVAAASQIIGHADHLKKGIMIPLWFHFITESARDGFPNIIYSRWDDGTEGLRYWKHSVGLRPEIIKQKID